MGRKRRNLAVYLGLQRGQRFKIRLAFYGSLLAILLLLIVLVVRQFMPPGNTESPIIWWKGHLLREKPKM